MNRRGGAHHQPPASGSGFLCWRVLSFSRLSRFSLSLSSLSLRFLSGLAVGLSGLPQPPLPGVGCLKV
jgi:hypothetical protein